MLRNIGETVPARGGVARFLPKEGSVKMSLDLAICLGWNAPHEIPIASFLHPDDCSDVLATVTAISSGEMSGAISRSRVVDCGGVFRTLDWSFLRNSDPSVVCGVGMLQVGGDRVNTGRLLKEVVEGMTDGFAIYDPDDRLILSNAAYRAVLPGFSASKLHGLQFSELAELYSRLGVYDAVGTDQKKYVAARIAAHRSGHSVLFQTQRCGRVERIEERRLPSGHIVAVHADVTEMYRDSQEVQQKAKATLDFVSVISHELRTPLVGLIGMLDEFVDATTEEERDRIVTTIKRSSDHLMNIANSALDLAKIEQGKMQLEQKPFDPVDSLSSVIDRYALISRNKNLKFVANLKDDLGLRSGDSMKFTQIVENLLSNAVKFTSQGQVELSLTKEVDEIVRIVVTDTGIGISPSFISQMMKPFMQADASLTRQYGGTGLGLSVVSHLVKLMGGTISCTSNLGEGATFTVHLPLPFATEAKAVEPSADGDLALSFAGKRVLIADDNEINRAVMNGLFQRMQFETTLAKDGEEALSMAIAGRYDLVILDISMPKIDGIEVLHQLRQLGQYLDTPIIAVTANVLPHEMTAYKKAGFDACITKPFRRKDLATVLVRFMAPEG